MFTPEPRTKALVQGVSKFTMRLLRISRHEISITCLSLRGAEPDTRSQLPSIPPRSLRLIRDSLRELPQCSPDPSVGKQPLSRHAGGLPHGGRTALLLFLFQYLVEVFAHPGDKRSGDLIHHILLVAGRHHRGNHIRRLLDSRWFAAFASRNRRRRSL